MTRTGGDEPCPCGSGRKRKHCCGGREASPAGDSHAGPAPTQGDAPSSPQDAARLGARYLTGELKAPYPGYGVSLIEQAAAAGDAEALDLAATISSCSLFGPRNWDQAFDFLARAAQAGHEPAQTALRALAVGPTGAPAESADWNGLRKAVRLEHWFAPATATTLRTSPRIQIVENFVSKGVCDWIIDRARGRLSRATIYDKDTGGVTEDGRRTNSQCDLDLAHCGVLTFMLRGRIAALTQRPDPAMEIAKVLHYQPGETFAVHYDYLDPNEPSYQAELSMRGQRTDTFLIYLNDDFEGGETHFPNIDVSYRGKTGDAIWFANVTPRGEPDEDTIHAGLPPTAGEKWLFSQWIRQYPAR